MWMWWFSSSMWSTNSGRTSSTSPLGSRWPMLSTSSTPCQAFSITRSISSGVNCSVGASWS